MNGIEKKLEVLHHAIQDGASIKVSYHRLPQTEAYEKANHYSSELETNVDERMAEGRKWLNVTPDHGFDMTFFIKQTKEDQIAELEQQLKALKEAE
ncbi:hypothetical protein [Pseudalkalibacillus caeni]|uniref:Uncharacterized protein n=1 Tax=Exobacillus caeni TaxID=2574798 RepID=A0A5R9F441_9BACL|nr:hypothetical protein [Pseudalkalibacillus caeni]TLS37771.1 hypothetical protein FCL54_08085 [Pseudalkalibacillus caeni]